MEAARSAGPGGEQYCWWQCTIQGGRVPRDIDAVTVARGVEALGAGEIMLNCIDRDGTNSVRLTLRACPARAAKRPG